jgi:hypothetical protein
MLCGTCGCEGDFKNEETGEYFITKGAPRGSLGPNFLVSDRVCHCETCRDGCDSWLLRWMMLDL